jgi:CO dehydrogenase maturation factor
MVAGPMEEEDLGVACYHSKTGAVELLLNHLIDGAGEYVVVDMTAGADAFASGLFSRFDLTVVVVEPTVRSVSVHRQYVAGAEGFGVPVVALGNKVDGEEDRSFLERELGGALLASLDRSAYVRSMERGRVGPIEELEGGCAAALDAVRRRLDRQRRDWRRSHELAVEFHRRNATAWANATIGEDVAAQIDPDFVLDPRQLTVS